MARARRRRAEQPPPATPKAPTVEGRPVPVELLDAEDPLWHDRDAYLAWSAARGYSLPPQERMGVPAAPANRRHRAAHSWARENGLDATSTQLHAWGLW